MVFRCYSEAKEGICWTFHPFKSPVENYIRTDLNKTPMLIVFRTDYEKLLWDYVTGIYPITDPRTNEIEQSFDPCFDNWIGKEDWNKIIEKIKALLNRNHNRPPRLEKEFYYNFIEWIERELQWADIIVIDSNL